MRKIGFVLGLGLSFSADFPFGFEFGLDLGLGPESRKLSELNLPQISVAKKTENFAGQKSLIFFRLEKNEKVALLSKLFQKYLAN